ncbi:MAG: hypothetical protein OXM57_11575 [bacterium]|nr:hypothetical protein [bacterium]MDE0353318.1 hypothetical protein [bacterium]
MSPLCTVEAVFDNLRPIVEDRTAEMAQVTGHGYVVDGSAPGSIVVRLTTPGTAVGEASFEKLADTIYASMPRVGTSNFGFEVTVGRDNQDLLCKVATGNGTVMDLDEFVDYVVRPLFAAL